MSLKGGESTLFGIGDGGVLAVLFRGGSGGGSLDLYVEESGMPRRHDACSVRPISGSQSLPSRYCPIE